MDFVQKIGIGAGSLTGMMLALPTVVWAGVLFAIVVYLGTMQLDPPSLVAQ